MVVDTEHSAVAAHEDLQRLLVMVASAIVRDPRALQVDVIKEENRAEFRMSVAPGDAGAVIGPKGRTARALRTIIGAISVKQGKRFSLTINDAGIPE